VKILNQEQEQSEIDWAYSVLEAFKVAFDKASVSADSASEVFNELLAKLGDMLEAVMVLTAKEHKFVIYELVKSYLRMLDTWAKKNK